MSDDARPGARPQPSAKAPTVSPGERARALWVLLHPGPSLATTLAYVVFTLLAARGHPTFTPWLVTTVGMIAMQFAISAFNDYCDREADAHSQKFKPVALGILAPRVALATSAILTVIMVLCYVPFGLEPLLLACAFLGLGFTYDLGLKSTPAGALVMGLGFSLLPPLAWSLFARLTPALFWTLPIGLVIGATLHIADALPDLAADTAAGARTLAQTLGGAALPAQWLLLAVGGLLPWALGATGWTPARPVVLAITTPLTFALVAISILVARAPWAAPRRQRLNFILTVVTALTVGVGWVASALV